MPHLKDPSITREENKHRIVYKCHGVSLLYIYKTGTISRLPGYESSSGGPSVIRNDGARVWRAPRGQHKFAWE